MTARRGALIAALAGLGAALPARAQFGGGGMRRGPTGGFGSDGMRRRPPEDVSTEGTGLGAAFLVDAVGQRLGDCQQRLALQPRQLAAWNAFGGAVQAAVSDLMRPPAAETAGGNAVQRIGRRVDVARNRLAGLESIEEAARDLYEGLDEGQRLVADSVLPDLVSLIVDPGRAGRRPMRAP